MTQDQPTFEDAMKALETVIAELESGELTLDESLAKYEAGVKTYRVCNKLLEGAEQKVQLLLKEGEGQFATAEFDPQNPNAPQRPEPLDAS